LEILSGTADHTSSLSRSPGRLLETGWLLTAVVIPLWVNLWANQPFDPSKAALLRLLAGMLAAIWLAAGVATGAGLIRLLRQNPLFRPVVALSAILVLATLFAEDLWLSLFGSYHRGQGLLTLLSFPLLFLIVSAGLRTIEQARGLATAMVLSSVPIILLGGLQAAGIDPIGLASDARSPIYATLGRANFTGAYLAMLLPLTLALFGLAGGQRARIALGVLVTGQAAVIGLTLARGAWLAAAAGLLAMGGLWAWPRLTRRARHGLAALASLGALAAGLAAFAGLGQATAGSAAARRTLWSAAWDLVRQRPWLGYGPDSLEVVFPRVFPPQLVYYQGRDVFVDRAHNFVLDWAIASGLLGAAAFLALMAAFFTLGLRRLRHPPEPPDQAHSPDARRLLLMACLAGVAANLAGNLVSFDVTATALAAWLLMALAASPAFGSGRSPAEIPRGAPTHPAGLRMAAGGLVLLVGLAAAGYASLRPLLADAAHRAGVSQAEAGERAVALAAAQRAVVLWPHEPAHHRLLGHAWWRQAQASGEPSAALERAEAALLAAVNRRPADYLGWWELGQFYLEAGVAFDRGALALAHAAFQQAAERAPDIARLHVAWGQAYLAEGRLEAALERFQRAADLDATDGLAFMRLAETAHALGDDCQALLAYREAARWLAGGDQGTEKVNGMQDCEEATYED
jgi:O-antigen ligase/Tfp pilus assembly protein PilF